MIGRARAGVSGGRSGPFARNLIGSEQECESFEDIAHFGLSQDTEAISQAARTRKAGFTLR